jgi:hypothetical protein
VTIPEWAAGVTLGLRPEGIGRIVGPQARLYTKSKIKTRKSRIPLQADPASSPWVSAREKVAPEVIWEP